MLFSSTSLLFSQDLYNNIKKEPFKIPEDDGNDLMHTFFNPVKEGWLCKQGISVQFAVMHTFVCLFAEVTIFPKQRPQLL